LILKRIGPGKMWELDQLVERYRGQLESYRSALVRLTGLPENKIRMTLLFTSSAIIFMGVNQAYSNDCS
jgi:hypothetical protein